MKKSGVVACFLVYGILGMGISVFGQGAGNDGWYENNGVRYRLLGDWAPAENGSYCVGQDIPFIAVGDVDNRTGHQILFEAVIHVYKWDAQKEIQETLPNGQVTLTIGGWKRPIDC